MVRRIFDVLPYLGTILKKVETWDKQKYAILRVRIYFLNRKCEKFDSDNNALSELVVVDEQLKLIHPYIIFEIPGVEIVGCVRWNH